ncbi:MAG: PPK2 family polyphosphate kinase [Gemmatimonadales bacterium]
MPSPLRPVPAGAAPDLSDAAAAPPAGLPGKGEREERLARLGDRLEELSATLAGEGTRSLLVVLQGRDASGKDGVIRKVFGRINPAFCQVTSFKRPTIHELRHDFLWRVHAHAPPRGVVGVWNRSHYEDVVTVRIHRLVAEPVWHGRYDHINAFERLLADEGTRVVKLLLHVSRDEQRRRLRGRLDDPAKNWKFEPGDLRERERWDEYTLAYQEALARCSTAWAPWYVIPADRNGPRDLLIAELLVDALEALDPRYPPADPEVLRLRDTLA